MQRIQRNCAVGLLESSDGKILMGKKNPHGGGVFPDSWHLPGGGIEPGESQQEALRREIKEEVGIDIAPYHPDFVDGAGYSEAEKTDRATGETVLVQMHFYVFRVRLPALADTIPVELNSDLVEVKWIDRDAVGSYPLTPPSVALFSRLGYF